MLFSQSIPEKVLENSAASKFVSVLDSLQEYKQGIISDAVRSLNPILNTNEKWLRKYLTDYGFSDIPKGFPIRVMQQMLLNADTIMRMRGSRLGVEFFISVCCLGEAKIDSSRLYVPAEYIFLDSLEYGYITSSKPNETFNSSDIENSGLPSEMAPLLKKQLSSDSSGFLFLCDTNELTEDSYLLIDVSSKYFNGNYPLEKTAIESYLKRILPNYIGFTSKLNITWNFKSRVKFYYHELLNPQYVNSSKNIVD